MYCPSCGKAVPPGLSYCNFCGEQLAGAKRDRLTKSPEVKPETLIASMVFTFVFGLGAIAVLMVVVKAVLENTGLLIFFALLSFLIMLSLEGVIIRLLFRRHRVVEEADSAAPAKGQTTRELDATQARALPEHLASVTEHTTRAFDPVYPERTSKS
jgi:hypothetical protein